MANVLASRRLKSVDITSIEPSHFTEDTIQSIPAFLANLPCQKMEIGVWRELYELWEDLTDEDFEMFEAQTSATGEALFRLINLALHSPKLQKLWVDPDVLFAIPQNYVPPVDDTHANHALERLELRPEGYSMAELHRHSVEAWIFIFGRLQFREICDAIRESTTLKKLHWGRSSKDDDFEFLLDSLSIAQTVEDVTLFYWYDAEAEDDQTLLEVEESALRCVKKNARLKRFEFEFRRRDFRSFNAKVQHYLLLNCRGRSR